MNPCVAVFMAVDQTNGLDINVASREVFLCSDIEGQRKFLKNAREEMGCVFVNGKAPNGSFAVALPCTEKNFEKLVQSVQDVE